MGNCPASYLYCAHCDEMMPLPFRQPPRFYLGYPQDLAVHAASPDPSFGDSASLSSAANEVAALPPHPPAPFSAPVPQCLGYCSDCHVCTAVEDFSQSVPALKAQLAATELSVTQLRLQLLPQPQQRTWGRICRWLAGYWPPARRRLALQQQDLQQLQQQVQALVLLLDIRQQANRQPRCLNCASHAITAYPACPYESSGFLADLPEDLLHHCHNRLTSGMAPLDPDGPLFSLHIRTAPLYYAVDGLELGFGTTYSL